MLATAYLGSVAVRPALSAGEIATGTFQSKGVTLAVKSAIAFKAKSFLGGPDAVIVGVTNARVNADALADYYDRRRAMEARVKDRDTGVVYLEFRADGSYRGLSYYFGPENGCGFCTSEVTSTVKLVGGRLVGALRGTEATRPFAITLDLPLMSDDHGVALPADGGAPGAAYARYHAALVKTDREALKALLSEEAREGWAAAEKKDDVAGFVRYLARDHPDKSVRIVRGFVRDDTALLLFSGESSTGKLIGEVLLVRENGVWLVTDEVTELDLK